MHMYCVWVYILFINRYLSNYDLLVALQLFIQILICNITVLVVR